MSETLMVLGILWAVGMIAWAFGYFVNSSVGDRESAKRNHVLLALAAPIWPIILVRRAIRWLKRSGVRSLIWLTNPKVTDLLDQIAEKDRLLDYPSLYLNGRGSKLYAATKKDRDRLQAEVDRILSRKSATEPDAEPEQPKPGMWEQPKRAER